MAFRNRPIRFFARDIKDRHRNEIEKINAVLTGRSDCFAECLEIIWHDTLKKNLISYFHRYAHHIGLFAWLE